MILRFAARKTFNDLNNFIRGGWLKAKNFQTLFFR